jgi:hypothetical protein
VSTNTKATSFPSSLRIIGGPEGAWATWGSAAVGSRRSLQAPAPVARAAATFLVGALRHAAASDQLRRRKIGGQKLN